MLNHLTGNETCILKNQNLFSDKWKEAYDNVAQQKNDAVISYKELDYMSDQPVQAKCRQSAGMRTHRHN